MLGKQDGWNFSMNMDLILNILDGMRTRFLMHLEEENMRCILELLVCGNLIEEQNF